MAVRHGRYGVSTLGFLRSGIAAYRGPSALIKELIQNADDAPADRLEFEIARDCLIVRNSGVFSESDFEAIKTIASGGKRDNADVTGTWGTGFTAVFQITDRPEIRSSGRRLLLDPLNERWEDDDDQDTQGTEFRFPWRFRENELSREMEVEPWTQAQIEKFITVLQTEALQNLLFLRHLREIVLLNGRRRGLVNLLEVSKSPAEDGGYGRMEVERDHLTLCRHGHEPWHGTLFTTKRNVADPIIRRDDGQMRTLKRGEVKIAFGDRPSDLMLPGLLYNMLPTGVETGFQFQINGDFYPTSDRSGILTGDDEKSQWNHRLIKGIADLAADSLPLFKRSSRSHEAFYQLLPISCAADYLKPIVTTVQKAAQNGHYVWTVGGWQRPSIAQHPVDARLEKLLDNAGTDLAEVTRPGLEPDVQAYLRVRDFTLTNLAIRLEQLIRDGTRLEQAPALLNSRGRLDTLIHEFDRGIAEEAGGSGRVEQSSTLAKQLRRVPLALDQDGSLRRLTAGGRSIALVPGTLRALVPKTAIRLLDSGFQRTQLRFLERFLDPLTVIDIVDALRTMGAKWSGLALPSVDPAIGSWERIHQLWRELGRAILDRQQEVSEATLHGAPILVDDTETIQLAGVTEIVIADADVRELLGSLNLSYLHPELTRHAEYEQVWRLAGVERMGPAELICRLADWLPEQSPLAKAHAAVNSIEKLCRWYIYFAKHAAELSDSDRHTLRRIPFVLTNGGELAAAGPDGSALSLPSDDSAALDSGLRDHIPGLDVLVNAQVLTSETKRFLADVLGIKQLDRRRLLTRHVLDHFPHLPRSLKLDLLPAIRDEALADASDHFDLLRRLRNIPLIPSIDGQFHLPAEVYHPDIALKDVFPDGWLRPALGEDSSWLRFFDLLNLPKHPRAEDLVLAVQALAAMPATGQNRDQAMAIFTTLDAGWKDRYAHDASILEPLKNVSWLPSRNRPGWFRPAELVPAHFLEIVGSQIAVLEVRGRAASTEFSQFLAMPTNIKPSMAIAHLCHLGRTNTAQEPAASYGYLDQPYIRREATVELQTLRDEPVIYHSGTRRWYQPAHAYFTDIADILGDRRVSLPDRAHAELFGLMGVREHVDPIPDAISLIQEIADDVEAERIENPLSDAELKAVLRAHRLLIQGMTNLPSGRRRNEAASLDSIPSILDTGRRLCSPSDLFIADFPNIAQRFPGVSLPAAWIEQDLGAAHEQLLTLLGVRRLSTVVQRLVVDAPRPEPDPEWKLLLPLLAQHLFRIAAAREGRRAVDWARISVERVRKLRIRYQIELGSQRINGIEKEEAAFYDAEGQRILLSTREQWAQNLWPLANELADVIDPQHPTDVNTAIQGVLTLARDQKFGAIETYLDQARFPRKDYMATDLKADDVERAKATARIIEASLPEFETLTAPETPSPIPDQAAITGAPMLSTSPVVEVALSKPTGPTGYQPSLVELEPIQQQASAMPEIPTTDPFITNGDPAASGVEPTDPSIVVDHQRRTPTASSRFVGNTTPDTPRNSIDWGALRRRFPDAFSQVDGKQGIREALVERQQALDAAEDVFQSGTEEDDFEVRSAKIVLTGQGLEEGFLWLRTREVRALLRYEADVISVSTDDDQEFDLQIDRDQQVAFNDEALPEWFAYNLIPAGAVLHLERQSGGHYRLYATPCAPREVEGLRLLEMDADQKLKVTTQTRTVAWEINEAVYRAETRLEDKPALFAQAAGKGTIFEILIELFRNAIGLLEETWLVEAVDQIRRVSASTVPRELRQSLCFVLEGQETWRFDPDLLGAEYDRRNGRVIGRASGNLLSNKSPSSSSPNGKNGRGVDIVVDIKPEGAMSESPLDVVETRTGLDGDLSHLSAQRWAQMLEGLAAWLTSLKTSSETSEGLSDTLDLIQPPLKQAFTEAQRLDRINQERSRTNSIAAEQNVLSAELSQSAAERVDGLLAMLVEERGIDAIASTEFAGLLTQLLELWEQDPLTPILVEKRVADLDTPTWNYVVRPAIDAAFDHFIAENEFEAARQLLELDECQTGRNRSKDKERLADQKLAREYLAARDESAPSRQQVDDLLEVLKLDPDLQEARARLASHARSIAESVSDQALQLLAKGEFDEALQTIAECRQQYAEWMGVPQDDFADQPKLDATAEKIFATAVDHAELASDQAEKFGAAMTALITLREQVPPGRQRTPNSVRREAIALLLIGMEQGQRAKDEQAIITKLLAWWIGAKRFPTARERADAAPPFYEFIAAQAEKMELWDIAEAVRRKGLVIVPENKRHRWRKARFFAVERVYAEQALVKDRHKKIRTLMQAWPETDDFVRAIGQDNLRMLVEADDWTRFVV